MGGRVLRRIAFLTLGIILAAGARAAAPGPALEQMTRPDAGSLRSIAGWLREHGKEGYVGADVADPGEGTLEHRVATMAAQAIEAWRTRGVDGTIPAPGGGEMPAEVATSTSAAIRPAIRIFSISSGVLIVTDMSEHKLSLAIERPTF